MAERLPRPSITFVRGNDRLNRLLADPGRAERVAALDAEAAEVERASRSTSPPLAPSSHEPVPHHQFDRWRSSRSESL